jgi:hypothetical protein
VMSERCEYKDCLWFNRCVSTVTQNCYVACDCVTPQPTLKSIITIRWADTDGTPQKALCETRAQVVLHLNGMVEPAGFMNILFNETGVLLTATRSTFIKAARNGTLWDEGNER